MNEQLQAALLSILNSTINAATAAKDFLLAEVPDVIHQLLVWKALQSGITFAVGLLIFSVAAYFTVRVWRDTEDDPLGVSPMIMFPGMTMAAGGVMAALNLTWLQILVAPKLYLIEYAASLVK